MPERKRRVLICNLLSISVVCHVAYADDLQPGPNATPTGSACKMLTKKFGLQEHGVCTVPAHYRWNVETDYGFPGPNLPGMPQNLAMLRLYNPADNHTALFGMLDLDAAEQLHRDLGKVIASKRRKQSAKSALSTTEPNVLPNGETVGVDANGVAIIKLTFPDSERVQIPEGSGAKPDSTQ